MSSHPPDPPPGGPEPPKPPHEPDPITQELQHSTVGARVPEKVARGVFSNGVMVGQGPYEFILDFMLRLARPHVLAARVLLPPGVIPGLINAIRQNLERYQARFGWPPAPPPPPPDFKPPTIEEIYNDTKLTDEGLVGVYANLVLIMHGPSEFCLDFIVSCYPRPVVACRVFLAAPQVPPLLHNLTRSFQQYQQKLAAHHPPPPPAPPGPPPPTA
jgi:Protein of unknown function (DUF3467)